MEGWRDGERRSRTYHWQLLNLIRAGQLKGLSSVGLARKSEVDIIAVDDDLERFGCRLRVACPQQDGVQLDLAGEPARCQISPCLNYFIFIAP